VRANTGSRTISDFTVSFGTFTTLPTVLPPRTRKRICGVGDTHPLPEFAEVKWTGAHGQPCGQRVAVRCLVPKESSGLSVVFAVDDHDGLAVLIEPH
jgi:hypothetical protein